MNQLSKFSEIWIVDFEFKISEEGLPDVHCMLAREVHSQDLIRLSGSELKGRKAPPFDVGPGSLFVAYYSSAEFGCLISLGWALPAR